MSSTAKSLAEFVEEASEIVEALASEIGLLDELVPDEPPPELINSVFRKAHSLKGLAGIFNQGDIAHLAHSAEDLLDRLRLGRARASDELVQGIAQAVDQLGAMLSELSRAGIVTEETRSRGKRLADDLADYGHSDPTEGPDLALAIRLEPGYRSGLTEYEEHRLAENLAQGRKIWRIRSEFSFANFESKLSELYEALKEVGELVSTFPSPATTEDQIAFELLLASDASTDEILLRTKGLSDQVSEIPRLDNAPARLQPKAPLSPRWNEVSLRSIAQTVRVDIRRLDSLMNSVGELLLIKANLQRLTAAARQGGPPTGQKWLIQDLARETRLLERKLDELQKGILGVRMVPLSNVYDKLTRLLRKSAKESGKEIDFSFHGGTVELDKLIVEELSDPLMHIVQNAIIHGIERPEERLARGKTARGNIALSASQKGNHILLEVKDDGAGIDHARIREVAIARGLASAETAQKLSPVELEKLIFLPGFSTATAVSEMAGRGVGLDVARTNIARLSGIIDVVTSNKGTTFTLTLPVTLAIIRALIVGVSKRQYAVPLGGITEILSVFASQIVARNQQEWVPFHGLEIPLLRLGRHFGHPDESGERLFVLVGGLAQYRFGIAVDDLLGQQEIVIKPLSGRLRKVKGISGATDLGSNRTILVLDLAELVDELIRPKQNFAVVHG